MKGTNRLKGISCCGRLLPPWI